MKIITDPSVYLLSKQTLQQGELDRFLADHGVSWASDSGVAAEVVTETAGRVCYMSYAKPRPGGNAAYLAHIKETGHGSVLEHGVWTLLFTGLSRSLSHELVRHRAGWAYSQLSQRYVDESVAEYVGPPDLQTEIECARLVDLNAEGVEWAWAPISDQMVKQWADERGLTVDQFWAAAEAGKDWLDAIEYAHDKYTTLSDYLAKKAAARGLEKTDARKFARQAARSVLPNATETKLTVTVNARAARHFIEQRASGFADPEIRKLAYVMWQVLVADAPNLFADYVPRALPDGTFELTTPYRKV